MWRKTKTMDYCKAEQLFEDIFCRPENETLAVAYLAGLMSEAWSKEEFQKRMWHFSLLQKFFDENKSCPQRERYLHRLNQIEEIVKNDYFASRMSQQEEL